MANSPYSRSNGTRYHKGTPNPHKVRRRILIGAGAVVAVGVVSMAAVTPVLGSTVEEVKGQATHIVDLYKEVLSEVKAMNFAGAQRLALQARDAIISLESSLNGPLWGVAEVIPVYGEDVKGAKELIGALKDVTDSVLVPVLDILAPLNAESLFSSIDGQIWVNVDVVSNLASVVRDSLPAINNAIATIDGIESFHIGQLNDGLREAKQLVGPFSDKLDVVDEVLGLLPNLLGANGQERLYLIAAQNNVELRSTGGFPGAWCPVFVNNGTITLGDVRSLYDYMGNDPNNFVWMSDEEYLLFGSTPNYMPGNVNINPDFPRVCEMWAQFWQIFQGQYPNGILAMDPLFLQSMMALTPGTTLEDGSWMDGTNTARVLMSDTYWNYMGEPDAMDAHFASAAMAAVDAVASSLPTMSFKSLFEVIKAAFDNGNLLFWLADPAEESLLVQFGCAGEVSTNPTEPVLGIYLSNSSWSKIDWWLDMYADVSDAVPSSQGDVYNVTLTFANTATWDEIDAGDAYLLGLNEDKWGNDDILNTLRLFAPAGGSISNIATNGRADLTEGVYKGIQVYSGYIHPQIDNPVVITFDVTVSPDASEPLKVRKTPTCQDSR